MPQAPPAVGSKHSAKKIADNALFVIFYGIMPMSTKGARLWQPQQNKRFSIF